MATLWKGAISFGLVHIPIRLSAATEDRAVHFRQLHARDHTPIRYRKVCPACGEELEADEIVRGFEYGPGEFVVVSDEELAALPLPTKKTVEILDFVQASEVDPIYFQRSYYMEPGEGGARPYALLRRTLQETGRAGLCRVALRAKERLGLVRLYGDALLLETLHYPDEIRPVERIEGVDALPEPDPRELEVARQLVESLATEFRPERYRDRYRDALLEVIERKAAGREVVHPAAEPEEAPIDLMEALRESVRRAEERRALAGGRG